MKKTLLINR